MNADLAPDRRLHASGGHRNLFSELTRNLSTRTKTDGGALTNVVEGFVSQAMKDADARGVSEQSLIKHKLAPLEGLVAGYDFTKVVIEYFLGATNNNDEQKSRALR